MGGKVDVCWFLALQAIVSCGNTVCIGAGLVASLIL
jgi:hypothetical protein